MAGWTSFPFRRSKDKSPSPEDGSKPVRAMTVLQNVLKRQGSTATLQKSRSNSVPTPTPPTVSTTRAFQSNGQSIPRTASPQPSSTNNGRTASPSSSDDDVTLGSSTLPNAGDAKNRHSSESSAPLSKDISLMTNGSGEGLEQVAVGQTTEEIQATFTESALQPKHPTSVDASSPPTEPSPSVTPSALITESRHTPDIGSLRAMPSAESSASNAIGTVSEELVVESSNVPSPAAPVILSNDSPTSTTVLPLSSLEDSGRVTELPMASDPEPEDVPVAHLISDDSREEPTSMAQNSPASPPGFVCDQPPNAQNIDEKSLPMCDQATPLVPDSTRSSWTVVSPSPQQPPESAHGEITGAALGGIEGNLGPEHPSISTCDTQPSEESESCMAVALVSQTEETPDTMRKSGTGSDITPTISTQDSRQTPNILFFGETGAGKSSVINMLIDSDIVEVSNTADGETLGCQSYITSIDGQRVKLWDTAGLNEAEGGTVAAKAAMGNIRDLVGQVKDGISLLVYCIRATRFRPNLKDNYDFVQGTICQAKIPIVIIVTGLEHEVPMDAWWGQNVKEFDQNGMVFAEHACVTSTKGKRTKTGGYLYEKEFEESQRVVRNLIKNYFATTRPSWTINDKEAWALETSSKLDNYYDVRKQGTGPHETKNERSKVPQTQTWWEMLQSYFYDTNV